MLKLKSELNNSKKLENLWKACGNFCVKSKTDNEKWKISENFVKFRKIRENLK